MKRVALIIAVETYADPALAPLPFAAADAARFDELLSRHGFADADRVVLVDGQASKTAVESKLRRTVKGLAADDELIVFYAGRTFSLDGENYLTSHDTQSDEPAETSLSVDAMIAAVKKSAGERVVFFLDCCEREFGEDANEHIAPFDDGAFKTLLDEAPQITAYLSCRAGQTSHRSEILQHGIWTHHVCEAFAGDAPTALKKGLLTPQALQKHLELSVPRTLAATFSSRKKQTPWMCGDDDAPLADVGAIVFERKQTPAPDDGFVRQVVFLSEKRIDVKQLPGFNKKTHRVPDAVNRYNEAFVAGLAQGEIKDDLDAIYARLKKAFKFARADLAVAEPGDGTGSIVTPFFNYSIGVALNPENPAESVWSRAVDSIKVPEQVVGDAFEDVFGDRFERLKYTLPGTIDLEAFIDFVEGQKTSDFTISYDRELTYCELRFPDVLGQIRITPRTLSIVHKSPHSPRALIKTFHQVQILLDGKQTRGIAQQDGK